MLVKSLLGSLATKVALGVGVATASVTAAGAAGVLPAAAQHAVASVVGATTPFQLPDEATSPPSGTIRAEEPAEATTTSSTSSTSTTTSVKPTTATTEVGDGGAAAGGTREDNHGACVSTVARDQSLTGEDHGKAVSAVAQSDCGKAGSTSTTAPRSTTSTSTSTTVAGTSSAKDDSNKGSSAGKGSSGPAGSPTSAGKDK